MATKNTSDGNIKLPTQDAAGNLFAILSIEEGSANSFHCLAMNVRGTTYYYWPNSSGVLRYGTTEPTVSTQDSAGGAV